MERNSLSAHGMKSDEKQFFCQIYAIFWGEMVHVVIDRYFSLFLKVLKIYLNPRLSLIVSLINTITGLYHLFWSSHASFGVSSYALLIGHPEIFLNIYIISYCSNS